MLHEDLFTVVLQTRQIYVPGKLYNPPETKYLLRRLTRWLPTVEWMGLNVRFMSKEGVPFSRSERKCAVHKKSHEEIKKTMTPVWALWDKSVDSGSVICRPCLYQHRVEQGVCGRCGRELAEGHKMCEVCLAATRDARLRRLAEGRCEKCGRANPHQTVNWPFCKINADAYKAIRKLLGLCLWCPNLADPYGQTRCAAYKIVHNAKKIVALRLACAQREVDTLCCVSCFDLNPSNVFEIGKFNT